MRRLAFFGSLVLATTLVSASPVAAAPAGTVVLTFVCGDAPYSIMLSPGGGNRTWSVDHLGEPTGTTFHTKTIEFRFYVGVLSLEPATPPVFVSGHSAGLKKGQTEVVCEGSRPFVIGGAPYTAFITDIATISTK